MLPLSLAEPMVPHSIAKITGKDEVRRHLAELGLVLGEEVEGGEHPGGERHTAGEGQPDSSRQGAGQQNHGKGVRG